MNIFFDLDGTLIDSKMRLYALFQHLVPESKLTYNSYWELKKRKINHEKILSDHLSYSLENIEAFRDEWMVQIEHHRWLDLDKPFDGVSDYLLELSTRHKLFVVTARQSEEVALKQISQYGWSDIFERTFVTCQKREKYDLIKESVEVKSTDWFVGDTGKDIQTGKLLGINTAGVLSGFLGREQLLAYDPDLLADDVTHLNFKSPID